MKKLGNENIYGGQLDFFGFREHFQPLYFNTQSFARHRTHRLDNKRIFMTSGHEQDILRNLNQVSAKFAKFSSGRF